MNCFSSTLKDAWLSLGAVAVNGTAQPTMNSAAPSTFFDFTHRWLVQTQGMSAASQGSFEDAAFYTRPIYGLIGKGAAVDPSRLTVSGPNVNVTVTSQ